MNKKLSSNGINLFRNRIIKWFIKNKRNYPWRTTRDPFRILIAEMMLRRTKADQVKMVYNNIFLHYPDINKFARANRKKLSILLYPLGLRWRIPAFLLIAKEIQKRYGGNVPDNRQDLKSLPGVGDYVAGAVLSIAFNKKEWIVDSNIVRIFQRYFNIKTSKEGRRDRIIIEMSKRYINCRNPKNVNLAILDFTAMICTPRNPECKRCPLNRKCGFFRKKI